MSPLCGGVPDCLTGERQRRPLGVMQQRRHRVALMYINNRRAFLKKKKIERFPKNYNLSLLSGLHAYESSS
jgi:hypothetical protein